ncbi:MAG: hypothetical protein QMC74_20070 [Myxococcota bacterium]
MDEQVDEGVSSRGAAGWDIRFSDVPEELIEACKERLESLLVDRATATPIYRKLRQAL